MSIENPLHLDRYTSGSYGVIKEDKGHLLLVEDVILALENILDDDSMIELGVTMMLDNLALYEVKDKP